MYSFYKFDFFFIILQEKSKIWKKEMQLSFAKNCISIFKKHVKTWSKVNALTCKGHDTVVSLSAGDDKRLAEA